MYFVIGIANSASHS